MDVVVRYHQAQNPRARPHSMGTHSTIQPHSEYEQELPTELVWRGGRQSLKGNSNPKVEMTSYAFNTSSRRHQRTLSQQSFRHAHENSVQLTRAESTSSGGSADSHVSPGRPSRALSLGSARSFGDVSHGFSSEKPSIVDAPRCYKLPMLKPVQSSQQQGSNSDQVKYTTTGYTYVQFSKKIPVRLLVVRADGTVSAQWIDPITSQPAIKGILLAMGLDRFRLQSMERFRKCEIGLIELNELWGRHVGTDFLDPHTPHISHMPPSEISPSNHNGKHGKRPSSLVIPRSKSLNTLRNFFRRHSSSVSERGSVSTCESSGSDGGSTCGSVHLTRKRIDESTESSDISTTTLESMELHFGPHPLHGHKDTVAECDIVEEDVPPEEEKNEGSRRLSREKQDNRPPPLELTNSNFGNSTTDTQSAPLPTFSVEGHSSSHIPHEFSGMSGISRFGHHAQKTNTVPESLQPNILQNPISPLLAPGQDPAMLDFYSRKALWEMQASQSNPNTPPTPIRRGIHLNSSSVSAPSTPLRPRGTPPTPVRKVDMSGGMGRMNTAETSERNGEEMGEEKI